MPPYAKFLKEILYKKQELEDNEVIVLTLDCSTIIRNKLPPKLKDLISFSIPCDIGNMSSECALCDLEASVNLIPILICDKLDLGEIKPDNILM